MTLAQMYHPITATPFLDDGTYREIAPCPALRPYIRCFWGTSRPLASAAERGPGLVIPDTCMDIIFDVNYTKNRCGGIFCALDEHSYRTYGAQESDLCASFGIRFYAWSAIAFAERDFRGTKNRHFDAGEFCDSIRRTMEPMLFDLPTLEEKIRAAEGFLCACIRDDRIHGDFLNAVYCMLKTGGKAKISDLCGYAAVSERRLERLFSSHMGITPKAFSSLVRYQLLWQDIVLSGKFDVLDAVEKFGYTDQAHLLNDFRRHHLLNIRDAVRFAETSRGMFP